MTAVRSVSEIKRNARHPSRSDDGKPRSGSMLRTMYDDFQTGRVINVTKSYGANGCRALSQLRDFYGMEIVTDSDGGHRLAGEWHGPYYVPVERIVSL